MIRKHLPLKGIFLTALLAASLVLGPAAAAYGAEETENTAAEEVYHTAYYEQLPDSNQWENWPQGPFIEAQAGILMDFNTGAVLYEKNADQVLYPASITKIMTTLLACEKCSMKDTVTTSENAVYDISSDSSKTYLEVGEQFNMYQMLMAVMLQSANDAAYAVAEHTSGSMKKFVELMNRRVREIGCSNTHFNNPHGLHAENHYTTARDMALIMKTAWRNARFRTFAGRVTYEIPPTKQTKETRYYLNNHKMMKTEAYEYEGVLGGKTGYTDQAGNTLVTVAKRGRTTLISVILNGVNGAYGDTAALLDYGFQNFETYSISNYVENFRLKALPCDRLLFPDGKLPSLLETRGTYYVTVPLGVKAQSLRLENITHLNAPGKLRIQTNLYYGSQLAGTCYSYEKEVLSDLFCNVFF